MGIIKRIFTKKETTPPPTSYPQSTLLTPTAPATTSTTTLGGIVVTTTPTPTPTPKPSGGGGGYLPQSTLLTPTPAATSVTQQIAQDIGPISTVSPAVPATGFKAATSYYQRQRQMDVPIFQAGKGAVQIAIGGIKRDIQKEREAAFRRKVEKQKGSFGVSEEDRRRAAAGYSGTATGFGYTPTTEEVLIRNAKLGSQAALVAYSENKNKQIETEARVEATNLRNENTKIINDYAEKIQGKINSGEITYEQGVEYLQTKQEILLGKTQQQLENSLTNKITAEQSKIDKVAKTGRISRIALTTAGSIAAGFIVGPAIAAAPRAVQTAGLVGGGAMMIKPVKTLTAGLIAGTATGLDVAELVAPTAGFIVGAGIGSRVARIAGTKGTANPKLNVALETAEIKSISVKTLSSESQIKALKIPEPQKVELLRQFRIGESVSVKTWKLKAKTPELQNILDTSLNKYEIVSVGETKSINNLYTSNSIVRVSVEGGKVKFVDFTTGNTIGIYDPKAKLLYSETLYTKQKLGDPVREVGKTFEVTQPQLKNIMDEGQFKRIVGGKTYSYEGLRIEAPKGKQITYKDLMDVVQSEKIRRYPSTKTTQVEIQKAVKAEDVRGLLLEETTGTGFGITGKQIKFITEKGAARVEQIPKPVEFEKLFNKKIKPFDVSKEINFPKELKSQVGSGTTKGLKEEINLINKELDILSKPMKGTKGIGEARKLSEIDILEKGSEVMLREKPSMNTQQLVKQLEKPSVNTQQMIKQLEKQGQGLDYLSQLETPLPVKQIKGSLKIGAEEIATKQITPTKTRITPATFDVRNIEKELQKSYEDNILNVKQIQKQLEKQKVKVSPAVVTIPKPRQIQFPSVVQIPSLSVAQAVSQKQVQRLLQTPKLVTPQLTTSIFQTPRVPVPKIDVPIIPIPFGARKESAGQKQLRKLLTRKRAPTPKYTASIAAAAFQAKPIKVSRKEYQRLSKVIYTGGETRPRLQIIDGDAEKTAKKFVQSVKF